MTTLSEDVSLHLRAEWNKISPFIPAVCVNYTRPYDKMDHLNDERNVIIQCNKHKFNLVLNKKNVLLSDIKAAMREFVKSKEYQDVAFPLHQ